MFYFISKAAISGVLERFSISLDHIRTM